jgi:hypothetical protein
MAEGYLHIYDEMANAGRKSGEVAST